MTHIFRIAALAVLALVVQAPFIGHAAATEDRAGSDLQRSTSDSKRVINRLPPDVWNFVVIKPGLTPEEKEKAEAFAREFLDPKPDKWDILREMTQKVVEKAILESAERSAAMRTNASSGSAGAPSGAAAANTEVDTRVEQPKIGPAEIFNSYAPPPPNSFIRPDPLSADVM